jgi:hypothetical protein
VRLFFAVWGVFIWAFLVVIGRFERFSFPHCAFFVFWFWFFVCFFALVVSMFNAAAHYDPYKRACGFFLRGWGFLFGRFWS